MKKITIILLALVLVFSLSACGEKADKSAEKDTGSVTEDVDTDDAADDAADDAPVYGYVKITLPDGWEYVDDDNKEIEFTENASGKEIQFTRNTSPAKEAFDKALEFWEGTDNSHVDMGEKTYGQYTYFAHGYTVNGKQGLTLHMDHPLEDSGSLTVDCFKMDPEDPIIAQILDTVTIVEEK